MKIFNRKTGNIGEKIAVKYLKKDGYKIIETNYRTRLGEIDIICQKDKVIVFVEVKTKTGVNFGYPEDMINQNKLTRIRKLAEFYLTTKKHNNLQSRVDVIAIVLDRNHVIVSQNHHQNVY